MLENFAIQTIAHLAGSSSFLEVAFKQIQFNKGDELKTLEDELTNLRSNKTKLEALKKNMTLRMADDKDVKNSKKYLDPIDQWQGEIDILEEEIRSKTRYVKKMKNSIVDKKVLKNNLTNFVEIFRRQPIDQQKRLTNLIFSEIISEFKTGEKDGLITWKIRGNGDVNKMWSEIENTNRLSVRSL
jgi:hypothetical protein